MKKIIILLISCIYCSTLLFSSEWSNFKKGELYGFINKEREVIIEPKYTWIDIDKDVNIVIAYNSTDKKYEVYNKSLKLVYKAGGITFFFPTENTLAIEEGIKNNVKQYSILNLTTGNITQNVNEKNLKANHGFRNRVGVLWDTIIDIDGKVILSDISVCANTFSEGLIAVRLKNGKSGFVNKKGKFVINADFSAEYSDNGPKAYLVFFSYFHEGYALVEYKDKVFLYNKEGIRKEVPEDIELAAIAYNSGLVPIRDKTTGKYGYMNPEFEIVIPYQFTAVESFVGPYAIVTYQEKDAIVDTKGNIYFCDEFCK